MALLSVLWVVGVLAVIAVSLGWSGGASYRLAQNNLEAAANEAVGEAGVSRAILSLIDVRPERRWRVDGAANAFAFAGLQMKISIQDELGRIDLNHVDAPILNGLLRSVGANAQLVIRLTDRILDWRESRPFRRLNGAKEGDYRAAGSAYRPRRGPFQSVDELLMVLGMTPELFRRIEPALTVYSGRQFIDPQVAPREALLALPGMNEEKVRALMAARSSQRPNISTPMDSMRSLTGRAYTIRVEIESLSKVVLRQVVVRMTGNHYQPYWILNWNMR